jgi:phosphatidylglycerophosphate synthase
MLEHTLRRHYQQILVDPLLPYMPHYLTPLSVTWLSGIFGILFIPFLLFSKPLIAISCLLISGFLDTVDGSLARFRNKSSDFGSVMDIMMDRVVEFAVLFSLYLCNPSSRALGTILMLGSILMCITSFLVVGIFTTNQSDKGFHYSPGLMERAEAFIFFIAMVLLPDYFNILSLGFCLLVSITALIRLTEFKRAVSHQELQHDF